jgi:hypothetical protein
MLPVLEGFGNFIKHGVSFLFLPTDFQALPFTSPLNSHYKMIQLLSLQLKYLQTTERQNARISKLTQAFQ